MPLQLPSFRPSTLPLQPRDVHLWLLDIRDFKGSLVEQALAVMSNDERTRAQRFIRGKDEYLASRWLLRKVLAHYLKQQPESLAFSIGEKGKPYIADSSVQFNLSHSGPWALVALAEGMAVGVDVEQTNKTRDLLGLAESYYHPDEFVQLKQRLDTQQVHYFYQLWTRKEALLKAMGVGISAGMENLNFSIDSAISVKLSLTLLQQSITDKWHFHQWQLPDSSYCALATACSAPPHTYWFNPLQTFA